MMKALLGISLLANITLGYMLATKKPEKEVVERLVIETHAKPATEVPVTTTQAAPQKPVLQDKEKKQKKEVEFVHFDSAAADFQDAGERMEAERMEFLTEKLGMTDDKLAEHNRIREDFFRKSAEFWNKNPMRELSFQERRDMIKMEEDLYTKLEKLHGKKNWERYQKFRESYNQRGYKKQMEENQPFIFMGL